MYWKIEFLEKLNLVRIIYWGNYSTENSLKAKEDYLTTDFWHPGMSVLNDCRLTSFGTISLEQLRTVARFISQNQEKYGHSQIAYLVKSESDFGIIRQLMAMTEFYTHTRLRVFLNETKALEWLQANGTNNDIFHS